MKDSLQQISLPFSFQFDRFFFAKNYPLHALMLLHLTNFSQISLSRQDIREQIYGYNYHTVSKTWNNERGTKTILRATPPPSSEGTVQPTTAHTIQSVITIFPEKSSGKSEISSREGRGGERSRSENRWRVQKGERRWGDDEGEVIMMQKSQFSGRLGAMRRDTPRCCAIIITTGDIIPSPDLQRGWRELRRLPVETDFNRSAGCL